MLQTLRNKAQSTLIQAVVVIIALVFIFWGVGTNLMNNREAAIVVNGEEISFQDYQVAYDRTHQNIAAQFGGTLPKGLAESLNLKQQVINQLVQSALLRQGAIKMGLIVSEEEILNTISSMVQFQENGGFDMEKYKTILSANRLTPHKFETNMRHDMLAEKTIRDIGKFASLASEFEIEELYRQDKEKIAVTFTAIAPELFRDKVKVNEAELATWFDKVKDNYRSEAQMKLRYLDFSYAEVGKKITIDDARITAYYEGNLDRFTTPERRRASHILLRTEGGAANPEKAARAEELAKLAKASDDFAAIARQYSEDSSKENGGDLGFFSRGQMIPVFEEAVFAMQVGEVSGVVQTEFGYHIVKLEAIEPAVTQPLSEAKDNIQSTLQEQEAQALAFQLANTAYEGIIGAGSLEAYADKNPGQPIIQTDFFQRSTPPAGQNLDEEFLNRAFALKAGELSSLLKTPAGYFIVFAEEIKEPDTPALAAVRDQATSDYIEEKSIEMAEQTANEVLKKLGEGQPFATVTGEAGLPMNDSGFLGRDGSGQSPFPATLIDQVFKLSKSEPLPAEPARDGDTFYVFSFQERQVPEIGNRQELEPYRQALLRMKQQELLNAFIRNLEQDAQITVHKSL